MENISPLVSKNGGGACGFSTLQMEGRNAAPAGLFRCVHVQPQARSACGVLLKGSSPGVRPTDPSAQRAPSASPVPASPETGCIGRLAPRSFHDKYRWTGRQIGRGSSGVVYLVYDKSTGGGFACKVQKTPSVDEVDMHSLVAHEALITLFGAYPSEVSGVCFMVYELMAMGDLMTHIMEAKLGPSQVGSIMKRLLSVLACLHGHGFVHRDVKPENIFMSRRPGDTKLADFDLVRKLPEEGLDEKAGTLMYMAPEVFVKGRRYDGRADVWSAGVVMYNLVCRRHLFGRMPDDPALILRAVCLRDIDFGGEEWKAFPQEALYLCRAMLRKDPSTRPTAEQALSSEWFRRL